MATVTVSYGGMSTVEKGRLSPIATDIIQPDFSMAWTKVGTSFGGQSCSAVHGSAHHLSISEVPLVIAHRSPRAIL